MEKSENYAIKHGFKRLTLGVNDWNKNAIGFYNHLGYQKLKEVLGRTKDEKVIYMYKDLER
jgi:ribosomal protein S18 acetylase RimI-like enzyme